MKVFQSRPGFSGPLQEEWSGFDTHDAHHPLPQPAQQPPRREERTELQQLNNDKKNQNKTTVIFVYKNKKIKFDEDQSVRIKE